jgi:Flp pilus assembly protein TadG
MTILRRSTTADRIRTTGARHKRPRNGQTLVEFSLSLIPFLLILMGIVDLGRGIYMYNGVAQAAREIARTTAVHPCNTASCTLGNSTETLSTISTQKNLIPGLGAASSSITFTCTTVSDAAATVPAGSACSSGSYVRVQVTVRYSALTPVLGMVAPSTLSSTAHIQVP